MIRVREAVIVEGRYDKIKLSSLVDGIILETGGFRIFKDPEKLALIRRLAESRGIVILTDSDSAGFLIRNYLNGAVPPEKIKHAYIPDLFGKEKRKDRPSKEGKLGVEGVPVDLLLEALRRAGVVWEDAAGETAVAAPVTKADLYECGLSGQEDSAVRRKQFLRALGLPEHLSANALVRVLGGIYSKEEFYCEASRILGGSAGREAPSAHENRQERGCSDAQNH